MTTGPGIPHEPLEPELGVPVFPFTVLHYFFTDFSEPCPLRQDGNIAVHLAVNGDFL